MTQLDEILKGPEYFYCEKEHCRLRIEVCLKRQKANQERRPFKSISFVNCEKCDQGARNQLLKTRVSMNPKRGKGERKLDCDHYGVCLDLAAKKDWKSFNCESCLSFEAEVKEVLKIAEKDENTRICEDLPVKSPQSHPAIPIVQAACQRNRGKQGELRIKAQESRKRKRQPKIRLKPKNLNKIATRPSQSNLASMYRS